MFGISTDFSFLYSIFCIFIGVIYSFFLYKKENSFNSKYLLWALFIFRTIVVSILAFLLLSPVVNSTIRFSEKPIVIIANDNSESVFEKMIDELDVLEEQLQDFQIHKYSFSDGVTKGIDSKNEGLRTNFSNLFSEIQNQFENRNIAGLIMATDGCYNSGSNPEFIDFKFPVYPIALGDTSVYKDIRIDNVLSNEISFYGNTFPVEVSLASYLLKNQKSRLIIRNKGQKIYNEIVDFSKGEDYKTLKLYLKAENVGLQTYNIEISSVEGERNAENNSYKLYVDVLDSRYNILILKENSHPDISAFKSVLEENKNYKIEVKNIEEEIIVEKYQLAVVFGVENLPKRLVEENLPLIIFNANQKQYSALNVGVGFESKGGYEDVFVAHNQSFNKFTFSPNLLRLMNSAPPLSSAFGKYALNGNVEHVLNQKIGSIPTANPVIMLQEINERKLAFVTSEGWWKWRMHDFAINNSHDAFDELFGKLSQYMLLQDDKSLFRLSYRNQVIENEKIVFEASLFNKSYELVNSKNIELLITNENQENFSFQFAQNGNKYIADLGVLEVGKYTFTASVSGSDLQKSGVFDVVKLQLEQQGIVANHQILRKIAHKSSGKVFHKNQLDDLAKTLNESEKNKKVIYIKEKLENLINIPMILLSLLILISLEWFLRKYNGLI